MTSELGNHGRQKFRDWWSAPPTGKDRLLGAVVGGLGFFWIGLFARLMIGPMPVSLGSLAIWAVGAVVCGLILGTFFPKATTCVCFPFSVFGVGN